MNQGEPQESPLPSFEEQIRRLSDCYHVGLSILDFGKHVHGAKDRRDLSPCLRSMIEESERRLSGLVSSVYFYLNELPLDRDALDRAACVNVSDLGIVSGLLQETASNLLKDHFQTVSPGNAPLRARAKVLFEALGEPEPPLLTKNMVRFSYFSPYPCVPEC